MGTRSAIVEAIEVFIRETGISASRLGTEAVGDAKFVRRLRDGYGLSLSTIEKAENYMQARRTEKLAA